MADALIFDADRFLPRPVEIRVGGAVHRLPGRALTVEVILAIQESIRRIGEGEEDAFEELASVITDVLSQATPPVDLGHLPPAATGPLAQFILEACSPANSGEAEHAPPRRRAGSSPTTSSPGKRTRRQTPRKEESGS